MSATCCTLGAHISSCERLQFLYWRGWGSTPPTSWCLPRRISPASCTVGAHISRASFPFLDGGSVSGLFGSSGGRGARAWWRRQGQPRRAGACISNPLAFTPEFTDPLRALWEDASTTRILLSPMGTKEKLVVTVFVSFTTMVVGEKCKLAPKKRGRRSQ